MDPLLSELRASLERLGYVVVPHGDHLCVRLAMAASVRIYSSGGQVRFAPRFGPFSRMGGFLATSAGASVTVGAVVFTLGVTPLAFFAGFVGVLALAHDACRFVVTEGCLSRLQQLVIEIARGDRRLALAAAPAQSPVPLSRQPGIVTLPPGGPSLS